MTAKYHRTQRKQLLLTPEKKKKNNADTTLTYALCKSLSVLLTIFAQLISSLSFFSVLEKDCRRFSICAAMSVDGRLIADVQRLRTLDVTSLFLLVSGSKGAGKTSALRAFTTGLAAHSVVVQPDSVAELLRSSNCAEGGVDDFTVCQLSYLTMAEESSRAASSLLAATQLRRLTILVVDDVDVLWMLCGANRIVGHLQRLLDLALSSPSCAVVASALSLDAVPSWLLERKMPVVHPLRELTEAGMRRLLRAVPQPLFKRYSEEQLSTQTLSTSRSMLLFNACMTLHGAAQGLEAAELSARAKDNSSFLHHRRPPTEGGQRLSHHLYGMEDIIHRLRTLLSVFVSHSATGGGGRLMSALSSSTGVLLHGPSGCGKSSLTRQLAADFPAVPFFFVECTMLFSKFLGESEEQLREVYRRARTRAPSVVILEDMDVIAQSRGAMSRNEGGGGGEGSGKGNLDVTKRMLAGLLCELDGVTDNSGVLTIGVTNAPRVLDAAVLRQGRLETIMHIPPLMHDGAVAMCRDFFQRFSGTEEERAECSCLVATRAVGCSAASLEYVLRKIFEEAVGQAGWSSAQRDRLALPSRDALHGLLFEHCTMLQPVTCSHFE